MKFRSYSLSVFLCHVCNILSVRILSKIFFLVYFLCTFLFLPFRFSLSFSPFFFTSSLFPFSSSLPPPSLCSAFYLRAFPMVCSSPLWPLVSRAHDNDGSALCLCGVLGWGQRCCRGGPLVAVYSIRIPSGLSGLGFEERVREKPGCIQGLTLSAQISCRIFCMSPLTPLLCEPL